MEIARTLADAKARGVNVRVILDKSNEERKVRERPSADPRALMSQI